MKNRISKEPKLLSTVCYLLMFVGFTMLLACPFEKYTPHSEITSNSVTDSENDTLLTDVYGIITDTGYVYFQAFNQENKIVNLRIQKLFIRDINDYEICLSFISGLYIPGDSISGTFAPGEGNTLSYFTERYFFPCRLILDRQIPDVDGHLTSFRFTEDLARNLPNRPTITFGY